MRSGMSCGSSMRRGWRAIQETWWWSLHCSVECTKAGLGLRFYTVLAALGDRLTAQGDFYLSTAEFKSKRYLRLVFINPKTSLDNIRQLIRHIRDLADQESRRYDLDHGSPVPLTARNGNFWKKQVKYFPSWVTIQSRSTIRGAWGCLS